MNMDSDKGQVKWQSPSNIALVKYWGKKGFQLPSNASISFTLSNCHTTTELNWQKSQNSDIQVYVDGQLNMDFLPKIQKFYKSISKLYPVLNQYSYIIKTTNTFPHSSGIASSASGMSALALCVTTMLKQLKELQGNFLQTASNLARIGSGSASRSVYGGTVVWGQHHAFTNSADDYAIPFTDVHSVFNNYQDTILLVHEGQKSVSSSVGHDLLNDHPFAEKRFEIAGKHMIEMQEILKTGSLEAFTKLLENEALMLHGLMMTSNPAYLLMEPNTVAIIKKIQQ